MSVNAFPHEWHEWREQWNEWRAAHSAQLERTSFRFPGKNFLADEKLGTWKVNGRIVELSEVTFPNLSERDERGNLIRRDVRGIGITYQGATGTVVHSFAELESELGL